MICCYQSWKPTFSVWAAACGGGLLAELRSEWVDDQRRQRPHLRRVGIFGSYGRGDASVGSDLDLVLIDALATGPQYERLRAWPLDRLPLSCDALVLTPADLRWLD
jgi:hypothetical protein